MKNNLPFLLRQFIFSSLKIAPPPVEIMRKPFDETSRITSVSKSLKYFSPLVLMSSLILHPQRFSISASVSTNSKPSILISFPTVLLPLPGIPVSTIFSFEARISLNTLSAVSFEILVSRNFSTATTACITSIYKPHSALMPCFFASITRFVVSGLYTASTTPSKDSNCEISIGLDSQSGYIPEGVVFMIISVSK